jgi:PHD/YefM family antitoxin component YafN of YafNO toxin-antitoxin module
MGTDNDTDRSIHVNMISAQEIKRRGMAAVEDLLNEGPVRIVKNNRPRYVVMRQTEFDSMMNDLAEARLAASDADIKAGRTRKGSATALMAELRKKA